MKHINQTKALWIVLILLLISNIVWGVLFFSKSGKHGQHNHKEHFLVRKLDLDNEQKEKYLEFRSVHFEKIKEMNKSIKKHRQQLFSSTDSSRQYILENLAELHKELELERSSHFKKIDDMLNEKQKIKFKEVLDRINSPHKKRGRNH